MDNSRVLEYPTAFTDFLVKHGISQSVYDIPLNSLQRHFRINSFAEDALDGEAVSKLFGGNAVKIDWLAEGFYAIPETANVSVLSLEEYQKGQLFFMDASSGYSIDILDPQPGEDVLDLCCAPGAKLILIAEKMKRTGSLTGVDISSPRVSLCRKLLYKYNALESDANNRGLSWNCRLVVADGTIFPKSKLKNKSIEVVLDSNDLKEFDPKSFRCPRQNKSARNRARKRYKSVAEKLLNSPQLYDRVLIDAECTHDGSFKHLQKLATSAQWNEYIDKYLSDMHISSVLALQKQLIRNGFKLLKPNGVLVYSTCSLSRRQNEGIVSEFLVEYPSAVLDPIVPTAMVPCEGGDIHGTIRFTPQLGTSGLFVCRIRKKLPEQHGVGAYSRDP